MNPLSYSPRLVQTLPPVKAQGRVLKAYAMFARPQDRDRLVSAEWLEKATASVLGATPDEGDHPVGFLILHAGKERDYLLVSQWYDADMLKHWVRAVVIDGDGRPTLSPLEQRDLIACVWELEVIGFERNAWVNTVLVPGRLDQDSLDAYLETTFTGWV